LIIFFGLLKIAINYSILTCLYVNYVQIWTWTWTWTRGFSKPGTSCEYRGFQVGYSERRRITRKKRT
jgi:hypothetical protein